ncbi:MAG: 50S ribosomal protein L23 [Bacillota bacterium]|nr:50S ribosomal protein L23 [Bacillota bacterium]
MKTVYDVVIRPVITEHAMGLTGERKYTFEVDKRANKAEVKKAIEKIFDVEVEKVNTIVVKGKPKRQGRSFGYRRTWKKAIIKLTPESKDIELFEGMN